MSTQTPFGSRAVAPTADQRAVVWMPANTTAPPPLLDSLRKRDIHVTMTYSGLLTMAHACSAHMDQSRKVGTLIVLCEPTKLPAVAETCLAIKRYATRAKLWLYDPKGKQSLRAVTDQDLVNWGAVAPDATSTEGVLDAYGARGVRSIGTSAAFGLKLSGSDARPTLASERSVGQPAADSDDETLSAEELRMLLGRDKK